MSDTPTLTPEALRAELHHIHSKKHRTRHTVLLARMSPFLDVVEVSTLAGTLQFRVERARCELELRAALPEDPLASPTVVLVDWDPGKLPADLMGRVATGAVQPIARSRRLRAAFSGAQVSDELTACKSLVDAIVKDPHFRRVSPPGGLVTLDVAWRAWLLTRRVFGQESETEVTLIARFVREPCPPGLQALLRQEKDLWERLDAWLDREVGPVARWALRLWLDGKALVAAALAFVLDATRASLGAQDYVEGMLAMKLEELSSSAGLYVRGDVKLLTRWADLAGLLAAQLEDDPALLLRVVDAADRFLPAHPAITEALSRSDYLRAALDRRKSVLAEALVRAAESPREETSRDVLKALDALGTHKLRDADPGQRELFERARMAARLGAWLAVRAREVPFGASVSDVVVLAERAEDFVRQGAFADFARRVARGSAADPLGAAIQRVVERADALRDQDDVQFARALVTWNELGRTADRVLPIEAALDRFAARFLQADPARRILVLLLDGMAWDSAVELLESLEEAHYAPLRWRVPGVEGVGVAPVLAALPTTTEASRAALFAGQLLRPTEARDSGRDPVRFENHKTLRALGEKPRLLLQGQLQTTSGDASPDALELVASPARVVGVVVNAIDDMLKAGRQTRFACTLENLKPLRDLLDRATLANRAVLMVADHGHVQGTRMSRTARRAPEEDGGARWRVHRPEMPEAEGEVLLGGAYVWRPPGVERVALLVRETDSYGGATTAGEHGGASMAEVVSPAILIGSESLAERMKIAAERDRVDPDIEVRPLTRPLWWALRAAPPALPFSTPVLPPPQPATAPTKPRKDRPSGQIPLLGLGGDGAVVTPKPVAPPARAEASPWESFFARSKVLKQLDRKMDPRFVAAVEALAAEGGTLSVERLAQALGILAPRIEGVVASMGEILNADGTQVIQYEFATRMVRLDVAALKEIFE